MKNVIYKSVPTDISNVTSKINHNLKDENKMNTRLKSNTGIKKTHKNALETRQAHLKIIFICEFLKL